MRDFGEVVVLFLAIGLTGVFMLGAVDNVRHEQENAFARQRDQFALLEQQLQFNADELANVDSRLDVIDRHIAARDHVAERELAGIRRSLDHVTVRMYVGDGCQAKSYPPTVECIP